VRRKREAIVTVASAPATPPGSDEIDVSYPSIASSSEISFPSNTGVACIFHASDRTRSKILIHREALRCRCFICFLAVLDSLLLVHFFFLKIQ
jgi:hypothetical protein